MTKIHSPRIIQTIQSAIEARSLSVALSETVRSPEGGGKGIFAETVISRTGIASWDVVEQAADSYMYDVEELLSQRVFWAVVSDHCLYICPESDIPLLRW